MKLRDLIPLNELDFKHQASFDAYRKQHKMRPNTKVTIAGKETTVRDASKEPSLLKKIGSKLFGKKEEPVPMPKLDPKHPINKLKIWNDKSGSYVSVGKALENPDKYGRFAAKIQSMIDVDPNGAAAQRYIDKKRKDRKAAANRKKEWNKKRPKDTSNKKSSSDKDYGSFDSGFGGSGFGGSGFGGSGFGGSGFGGSGFGGSGFGGGSFGGAGAGGSW